MTDETTDEIHIEHLMPPSSQTIKVKARPSRVANDLYNWQEFPKSDTCEGNRMFTYFSSAQSPGHEPDMPLATGHIPHVGGEPHPNLIKPQLRYFSKPNPDTRYLEPDTFQGE